MALTFDQASKYVIQFGQYKGQTIDQIAKTDKGLTWLDWLRGEREEQKLSSQKELEGLTRHG